MNNRNATGHRFASPPPAFTGRIFACVVLSFLSFGLLTSCSQKSAGASGQTQAVPVTVAVAVQTNVPVQVQSIGHAYSYSTVAVRSQVDGTLARVHFQQGDDVKAGDLIYEIDPAPFEAALHQAEAMLAKDTAQEKKAEIDVRRSNDLFQNKIESADVHEQTLANADSLKATVQADAAAVESAKLQLSYCSIHSPIDGRTGNLLINAGNVVAKQTTILVTINQIKPMFVDFSVPEKNLPDIRKFMNLGKLPVAAAHPQQLDHPSFGELFLINNAVDTTTGNILLRANFTNADEALWPGEFVDTILTLTVRSNVVVVPTQAVQNSQNGESIFIVKSDLTVEERPVTVSERREDFVAVDKGVNAGEQVVITGQLRLVPGTKVEIQPPPTAQAGTPGS
ncbi:MAG: Multidrug resistance protein MdtA [Pedosphaera sp.]|nr:Multidrug resistance protein MdtA [Pedosphaera sp.]